MCDRSVQFRDTCLEALEALVYKHWRPDNWQRKPDLK